MVRGLAATGSIRDPAEIERALGERGTRDSITAARDVALNHLRTDAVNRVTVALAASETRPDRRTRGGCGRRVAECCQYGRKCATS